MLREEVFDKHGKFCAVCNDTGFIDCHHLIYRQLYDCTPDDLIPLCRRCHEIAAMSPASRRATIRAKLRQLSCKIGEPIDAHKVELNKTVLHEKKQHKPRFMSYAEYQSKNFSK